MWWMLKLTSDNTGDAVFCTASILTFVLKLLIIYETCADEDTDISMPLLWYLGSLEERVVGGRKK
jgi:hypothetical protein